MGLNGGIRWNKADSPLFGETFDVASTGLTGLQFGYARHLGAGPGPWLIGFEGDVEAGNQFAHLVIHPPVPAICRLAPGTPIPAPPGTQCIPLPQTTYSRSMEELGTVSARLRVGFAWEQVLLYATGGMAAAHVRRKVEDSFLASASLDAALHCGPADPPCLAFGQDSENLIGWTVGIGSELSVGSNLGVALEYRHADYGRRTFGFNPVFSGNGAATLATPVAASVAVRDDRITIRLNYYFHR